MVLVANPLTVFDSEFYGLDLDGVKVPHEDIEVKGIESTQDHEGDVEDIFYSVDTIVILYQDREYDLGPWIDLDGDVSEMLTEWASPT